MANWSPHSAKTIDVVIRGRDEAAAAFDSAAKKAGLLEGSFRSVTVMGAMRLHTAMQSVETVMANVKGIAALIRGDMEGMRKAADALPFGFGALVKELAGPVDKAVKDLWFKIRGIVDPYGGAKGGMSREAIAQMSRDARAIEQARAAFQKTVLSPRELAEQEAAGMSPEARAQFLAYRMGEIAWKEKGAALKAEKDLREKGRQALLAAEEEYLKAGASPEERIRLEVAAMGLEKEAAEDVLQIRLQIYRVEKDRADAAAASADAAAAFADMEQAAAADARAMFDEVQAQAREEMDAWIALSEEGERLTASLRTPLERLNDDMARYRELLDQGLISMETFRRAEARARGGAGMTGPDLASRNILQARPDLKQTYWGRPPADSPVLETNRILSRSLAIQEQEARMDDQFRKKPAGYIVGRLP